MKVFFFGSPGEGFSAFPSSFTSLVKGLDSSDNNNYQICNYRISNNKSIIKFIEYGLSGFNTNLQGSRGGRNFGIYIELEKKINTKGQEKLVTFIDEFFEAIHEKNTVFDKNKEKKFYKIISFEEVSSQLESYLIKFEEKFSNEFKHYFEDITQDDNNFLIHLLEKPKIESKLTNLDNNTPDFTQKESSTKGKKREKKRNFKISFTTLKNYINKPLFLLVLFLLVLFNLWNNNELNKRINYLEKKAIVMKNEKKERDKKEPKEKEEVGKKEKKAEKASEDVKQSTKMKEVVIVKSGDVLKSIVINYNQVHKSNFSTEQIIKLNKIQKKKNTKGEEYPFIKAGDTIIFE